MGATSMSLLGLGSMVGVMSMSLLGGGAGSVLGAGSVVGAVPMLWVGSVVDMMSLWVLRALSAFQGSGAQGLDPAAPHLHTAQGEVSGRPEPQRGPHRTRVRVHTCGRGPCMLWVWPVAAPPRPQSPGAGLGSECPLASSPGRARVAEATPSWAAGTARVRVAGSQFPPSPARGSCGREWQPGSRKQPWF